MYHMILYYGVHIPTIAIHAIEEIKSPKVVDVKKLKNMVGQNHLLL